MDITQEQIAACETLIMLEDQYLLQLQEGGDSSELRSNLEPLRKTMEFLRKEYGIDDSVRSLYDKYTRLMRGSAIFGDILNNLPGNAGTNDETN